MHVLTVRLLFHLNGKTRVQGQPPSCIIYHIPNVLFSDSFRAQLVANSAVSPDAFIIATLSKRGSLGWQPPLVLPPAPLWKGHPCVQWAALRAAYLLPTPSAGYRKTRIDKAFKDAQELARVAQEEHPQNGALWLAEAVSLFSQEEVDAALTALDTAAEKGQWCARTGQFYPYATRLLIIQGLSRLDAAIEANDDRDSLFIMSRVSKCLRQEMVNAVTSGDDERFSKLIAVRQRLQRADWHYESIVNRFRLFPADAELVDAMATRLGRAPLPDWHDSSYKQRDENAHTILEDYLKPRVSKEQVARLFSDADTAKEEIRRQSDEHWERVEKPRMLRWGIATTGGMMALWTLAALLVSLSYRLAFSAGTDNPNRGFLRNTRFWGFAILALIVGAVLMASAFNSVCQPVGFGPAGPRPLLSTFWENNLSALVMCIAWFAGKVLFHARLKFPCWLPSSTALLVWLYMVAIVLTAFMRVELANRLFAN